MYEHHHPDGLCWDDEATHAALIGRLSVEYPDGWALSATSGTLRRLLAHCPDGVRIGVWVKPFVAMKRNVTPAYAWEPVIFCGGRKRTRDEWTGRDWVAAMPPVFSGECRDGVKGMKPDAFCQWLFDDLLGMRAGDELVDLFHGSGAVSRAWDRYLRQLPLFHAAHGSEQEGPA
jgi:hypothetical protein